jgi:hypothetical protein
MPTPATIARELSWDIQWLNFVIHHPQKAIGDTRIDVSDDGLGPIVERRLSKKTFGKMVADEKHETNLRIVSALLTLGRLSYRRRDGLGVQIQKSRSGRYVLTIFDNPAIGM